MILKELNAFPQSHIAGESKFPYLFRMNEQKSHSSLQQAAGLVILTGGILFLLVFAKSLLMPIVIAAYLSMLLVPVVKFMERIKIPRILAIFAAILISISLLTALLWFFIYQITNFSTDLNDLQQRFSELGMQFTSFISGLGLDTAWIELDTLEQELFKFLKQNASAISNMAVSTLGSLGLFILIPVYLFMFLMYRDHFTQFAVKLFKNHDAVQVIDVVGSLRKVIQKYISGMLKVMVILAVMNAVVFYSFGLKHALFFAVFGAILNIVPYVGPLLGSVIPITFALLTKDSLWYPVGILISLNVVQTIEGNFLTPKIVGSNVSLNPITSLIALFIGGMLWGVVGMILFIPAAAIIKKLLELSPQTEVYGFLMGEEDEEHRKRNSVLLRWMDRRRRNADSAPH